MSPQEFDAILSRTLADRRLTGSEREALAKVLADEHLDDNRRAALRHRVLLNFEAQAENIPSDQILAGIVNEVKEKADAGSALVR